MDVSQEARLKAEVDVKSGQAPANTTNWDINARTAYDNQFSWLKKQQTDGSTK